MSPASSPLVAAYLKDLRLFFRDRKTLVLVVLTPVLIMFILGNLARDSPQKDYLDNVKMGFCNKDPEFSLPYAFAITAFKENCEAQTFLMVRHGELRGSLFVPEDFSARIKEGKGSTLVLLLDNSKGQISFAIRTAIESMVNDLNEKIGVAFINTAWENLRRLNTRLKFVVDELSVSRSAIEGVHAQALALNDSISKIDITAGVSSLDQVNTSLERIQRQSAAAGIAGSAAEGTMTNLSALQQEITAMGSGFANLSPAAAGQEARQELSNLSASYEGLCVNSTAGEALANASNISSICDSLNSSILALSTSIGHIESAQASLLDQSALLGNATNLSLTEYARLLDGLREATANLSGENLSGDQADLASAEGILMQVRTAQNQVREQIQSLDGIIINITAEVISVQDELNATTRMLDQYTSLNPQNIVRAVSLNTLETFPHKKVLTFAAPNMMLQVLLFLTLLVSSIAVVEERRSMTLFRTVLSPLPFPLYLLQKLLFVVTLCFIQIGLMAGVVWALGGSYTLHLDVLLALLLAAVLFASIGMFLGSLAKSENTALLSSLVLAIPMMFLSGFLFPFEGMSPLMAKIAYWSPLTMSVTNLERLLIYSTGLDIHVTLVQLVVSVVAFLAASALLVRSPSMD